jgi:ketosteroid isomerase-like protein
MSAESDSAMTAIRAKNAKFAAAFNAGQMDSVAALYMELGRIMPPNEKTAVGRPAIKAWLLQGADQGTFRLSLSATDVIANGPIALERGTFTLAFTPKAGAKPPMNVAIADTGKYLVHWQKVSGDWQLADDIWNSDKPAGPPPAAKAPARSTATKAPAKAGTKSPAKTTTKSPTKKRG